jgi:Ca2+-transporting ATPase
MTMTNTAAPAPPAPAAEGIAWHRLDAGEAAGRLGVVPEAGLTQEEAARRLAEVGPNHLAEPPRRPAWRLLADQFRNLLVVVLLGAAVLAGLIGDWKDSIVIAVVLCINATIGFVQEHRAERSMEALRALLTATARVRRGGQVHEVPAPELVPGDIVLLEAGDRVPADGRLLLARTVEVDESALTGESTTVAKTTGALRDEEDTALADRRNLVFMNAAVTRGRAEALVTSTGMDTQIGRVAELLASTEESVTPLQRQLDGLGRRLAAVAAVAVATYLALQLFAAEPLAEAVLRAVALAVAAIPEGLPAVLALTLALGMQFLARRGAIVKRMVSVETLGATTVICTDKTGTLTLNQMTARAAWHRGRRLRVSGEGYGLDGRIEADGAGAPPGDLGDLLLPLALCNDSRVRDGALLGDPTEGALLVLAAKGGVDAEQAARALPRRAEIPFDSARKYMATFHDGDADDEVAVFAKGAPDVLLRFCSVDSGTRAELDGELERLAGQGLRVLGVASGRLPAAAFDPGADVERLEAHLRDLTFQGLIGVLDPPRPEAREAVALCRRAGVQVRMITGDHAATATAIARELGIPGATLTGAELDRLDDEALAGRVHDVGVFARVTPEHKLRLVAALQRHGEVVAMTGDGVNDGPALKAADIGVAMGITGTDVAKEAASMILTDDNFATIVRAVQRGRTIYDNVVKFVRFQLSTNFGAILTVLGAQILGMPAPFTALQVLWVNIIMDGPPALALGVDPARPGVMDEPPRDPRAPILPLRRIAHLSFFGLLMAAGTLGVLTWASGRMPREQALTLTFTTFVLFQVFNVFNARNERGTALGRHSLRNRSLWLALAGVVVLQVLVVSVGVLQRVFSTAALAPGHWAVAVGVALTILVAEELRKALLRLRRR